MISTFPRMVLGATLLSDAERAENEIQNVVGGGGARNLVKRAQGAVEIEQQHFVGDSRGDSTAGCLESYDRIADKLLVARASQKSSFDLRS